VAGGAAENVERHCICTPSNCRPPIDKSSVTAPIADRGTARAKYFLSLTPSSGERSFQCLVPDNRLLHSNLAVLNSHRKPTQSVKRSATT